jgi:hypothetical protein
MRKARGSHAARLHLRDPVPTSPESIKGTRKRDGALVQVRGGV